MVRWPENEHPLSEVVRKQGKHRNQTLGWNPHPSGIDALIGPGSGRPRIRVSCVAGFMFGDRSLDETEWERTEQ